MAAPVTPKPGGLPGPIKSGITAAIVTFLTLFVPALIGFLKGLATWASKSGHAPLPGISTLGYAAISAVLAALSGLGLALVRWAQGRFSWVPGTPPTFHGGADALTVAPVAVTSTPDALALHASGSVADEVRAVVTAKTRQRDAAQADLDAIHAALSPPPQ